LYIALVQNNPTVGALEYNAEQMLETVNDLAKSAYPPDLVVFPAFAMTGMPLDGLAYSSAFCAQSLDVAQHIITEASLPCLFGSVIPQSMGWRGHVAEAEAVYCQKGIGGSLGFADGEGQRFGRHSQFMQVKINEAQVAIFLDCFPDFGHELNDCDLLIVMLAKEYSGTNGMIGSSGLLSDLRSVAEEAQAWMVVVNLVGGQDDVVFDGGSLIIDPTGSVVEAASSFETGVISHNLTFRKKAEAGSGGAGSGASGSSDTGGRRRRPGNTFVFSDQVAVKPMLPYEADWSALVLATRDYVQKNGFSEVVIGLSGGIDSAMTAALAVDAFGAENVHGVIMPSKHSSPDSSKDALELAKNLGINTLTMSIEEVVSAIENQSIAAIGEPGGDIARQNMQARVRMIYLMHLSNTFNWMLLNTGNKSEAATGFSTLYGDTAGAYAPFGNVYKTDLYELARWRNQLRQAPVIPQAIIDKPPSAELYPGQVDTDSLPPYEVLDRVLRLHIEDRMGLDQILDIIANTPGGDPIAPELVSEILLRVSRSEFKRHMEPLAPNIGSVDMGSQRAWPMTNGFVDRRHRFGDYGDSVDLMNTLRDWERPDGWGFLAN